MTEYSLTESTELEEKLRANLTQEYSRLRLGIHMSDLVLCLRQSLARKLYPMPVTTKQLGYFFDGSRRHAALQELYGEEGIAEKHGTFEGVEFSIDLYDHFPIEFKTTRANKALSDHWMRQLVYYMLAVDAAKGILQVQRINDKQGAPFAAFTVTLTPEQRGRALAEFKERKDTFQKGLDGKDLALVPIYRGEDEWLCKGCEYRKEYCDPIEAKKKVP